MTEQWKVNKDSNGRIEYHDSNQVLRRAESFLDNGNLNFRFNYNDNGELHGQQEFLVGPKGKTMVNYAWNGKPVSKEIYELKNQASTILSPIVGTIRKLFSGKEHKNKPN